MSIQRTRVEKGSTAVQPCTDICIKPQDNAIRFMVRWTKLNMSFDFPGRTGGIDRNKISVHLSDCLLGFLHQKTWLLLCYIFSSVYNHVLTTCVILELEFVYIYVYSSFSICPLGWKVTVTNIKYIALICDSRPCPRSWVVTSRHGVCLTAHILRVSHVYNFELLQRC